MAAASSVRDIRSLALVPQQLPGAFLMALSLL